MHTISLARMRASNKSLSLPHSQENTQMKGTCVGGLVQVLETGSGRQRSRVARGTLRGEALAGAWQRPGCHQQQRELGRRSYTSGPSNCWGHPTKCREGSSGKWLHRPQTPHYHHRVGPHNHSPLCRQRAWECEKGRKVEIANILLQPWTGPEAEIRISLLTKEK